MVNPCAGWLVARLLAPNEVWACKPVALLLERHMIGESLTTTSNTNPNQFVGGYYLASGETCRLTIKIKIERLVSPRSNQQRLYRTHSDELVAHSRTIHIYHIRKCDFLA